MLLLQDYLNHNSKQADIIVSAPFTVTENSNLWLSNAEMSYNKGGPS